MINSNFGNAAQINEDRTLNFILIDGTWNNSVAIFSRLKVLSIINWFLCFSYKFSLSSTKYLIRISGVNWNVCGNLKMKKMDI